MDDVARRTPSGWRSPGAPVLLLGTTRAEFGGSEWAWAEHGHLGGLPPAVDLAAERALGRASWSTRPQEGLLEAAHDLSDGGLAQALVESSLRYGVGVRVLDASRSGTASTRSPRCSPSPSARAVVAVRPESLAAFTELCAARGRAGARARDDRRRRRRAWRALRGAAGGAARGARGDAAGRVRLLRRAVADEHAAAPRPGGRQAVPSRSRMPAR